MLFRMLNGVGDRAWIRLLCVFTVSFLLGPTLVPTDSLAQGSCSAAEASADLDVNNVRARLYNNGGLFWKGSGNVYTVPKDGTANAIFFASSIWIGGLANGEELRFAGTSYGPWEFWPGPLDENGQPPSDCSQYDQIFSVYRDSLQDFREQGIGAATEDILKWPAELGAPSPPPGTTIRFVTTKPIPPQVPGLLSPSTGASVPAYVDLWWQAEDHLQLQVALDAEFEVLVLDTSRADAASQELRGLEDGETYYWRARTSNIIGVSAWSPIWSFVVDEALAAEVSQPFPENFNLDSVYPNPFRGQARIRFGLPRAARVRLTVFDVLGRRVAMILDETLPGGWHERLWDVAGASSGIYFIRLEAGGRSVTRQVVQVK